MDQKPNQTADSRRFWVVFAVRLQIFLIAYLVAVTVAQHVFFLIEWFFGAPYYPALSILTMALFIPLPSALIATWWNIRSLPNDRIPPAGPERGWDFVWMHYHWLLGTLALFGLWSGLYFLVMQFTADRPMNTLFWPYDHLVPFRPEFVYVYLTVYWMFLVALLGAKQPDESRVTFKAGMYLLVVCMTVFIFYPVAYPRPEIAIDSLASWGLSIVYAADKPNNCFPSMHCAMVMLAGVVGLRRNRFTGLLLFIGAVEIGFSTLFTKQHFIADVLGGFSLALISYGIVAYQKELAAALDSNQWRRWMERLIH
ncbi:MAG: phosphatase PAP2 family protein [Myxococcales bacterium]|nr:MAG: phosphatase PAP2 family protein [Myxococcales bacterium]